MTKALFFDIDGTLVSFETHRIPSSTIEALEAAHAKGLKIFIATGRPKAIINNLSELQDRNLIGGYITMNGAYCFVGEEVIYKSAIPQEEVKAMAAFCEKKGVPCIFVEEHNISVCQPNEMVKKIFYDFLHVNVIPTVSFEEASNKEVILLDEPVLGFDAIMRVEFYDMLAESFQKHPRIIIVSTHIIEEIARTIQKLIIIDKGSVRFFDTLQSIEANAFRISGLQKDVEAATQNLNVIGQDTVGGLVTSYIFDTPPKQTASVEIHPLSLQDFFIQMVGHKGGVKR